MKQDMNMNTTNIITCAWTGLGTVTVFAWAKTPPVQSAHALNRDE